MKLVAKQFEGTRTARPTGQPFTTAVIFDGIGNRFVGLRCELQLLTDPNNRKGGRDQILITGVIPCPNNPAVRELLFSILSHSLTNLYNEGQALLGELTPDELGEGLMTYIASGDWIADSTIQMIRPYYNGGKQHAAQRVTPDIARVVGDIHAQLKELSFEDDPKALDAYNAKVTADLAKTLGNTEATALEQALTSQY